jgi:hypothetical protein
MEGHVTIPVGWLHFSALSNIQWRFLFWFSHFKVNGRGLDRCTNRIDLSVLSIGLGTIPPRHLLVKAVGWAGSWPPRTTILIEQPSSAVHWGFFVVNGDEETYGA